MNIDYLDRIKRVETPPFLFTRIQQRIENLNTNTLTKKTSWALGISFSIIICLNIGLIINNQNNSQSIKKYAKVLNLTPDNNLYK